MTQRLPAHLGRVPPPYMIPPARVSEIRVKQEVNWQQITGISPEEKTEVDEALKQFLALATPEAIRNTPDGYAGVVLQRIENGEMASKEARTQVREDHQRNKAKAYLLYEKHPILKALSILAFHGPRTDNYNIHHTIPIGYRFSIEELNHCSNLVLIRNGKAPMRNGNNRTEENNHHFFHAVVDPQQPQHGTKQTVYILRSVFPVFPPLPPSTFIHNLHKAKMLIREVNPQLLAQIEQSPADAEMLDGFLDRIVAASKANKKNPFVVPAEFHPAVSHLQDAYDARHKNRHSPTFLDQLQQANNEAAIPLAQILPPDRRINGLRMPSEQPCAMLPLAPEGWRASKNAAAIATQIRTDEPSSTKGPVASAPPAKVVKLVPRPENQQRESGICA